MDENNILGVVLAGGKSKRFGKDKANVKLGNKTLIQHTLDKIKSKFNKIIIVSNTEVVKDYTIVKDCISGQLGPLVGVLSAMKWIKKNNYSYEWIITFPCDTPFFNVSIVDKFVNVAKLKNSFLYFVKTENKRHNIFGLWSMNLIETLEKDIKNSFRKVEIWADKVGYESININTEKFDKFLNINTKEDFEKAKDNIDKI